MVVLEPLEKIKKPSVIEGVAQSKMSIFGTSVSLCSYSLMGCLSPGGSSSSEKLKFQISEFSEFCQFKTLKM